MATIREGRVSTYVPLKRRAKVCLETCMALRDNESVLILSDPASSSFGHVLLETARTHSAQVALLTLSQRQLYEKEPPRLIEAALHNADVVVTTLPPEYACQFWHSSAREAASQAGTRVGLIFPPSRWSITEEELQQSRNVTMHLAALLSEAERATLTTDAGTALEMSLQGREGFGCHSLLHEPGATATIPDWGDAEISPMEGTSRGKLVVDGSVAFVGKVEHPIKISVEGGRVGEIAGHSEAEALRRLLDGADESARNVAEFGLGTVPRGRLTGHKDDSLLGTIHLAFGHNSTLGGKVHSNIHVDAVIRKPTVHLDGKLLMSKGNLVDLGT